MIFLFLEIKIYKYNKSMHNNLLMNAWSKIFIHDNIKTHYLSPILINVLLKFTFFFVLDNRFPPLEAILFESG